MIFINKILALWYYRILIFVLVCVTYYLIAVFTFPVLHQFNQELFTVFILCISLLIEGLRSKSKGANLGFTLSKHSALEFIYGTLYAAIPLILMTCAAYCLGASIQIQESINMTAIYESFEFMMYVAVMEELLFRGIIFQSVYERFGSSIATISLSLLFGLAHTLNPHSSFLPILNVVFAGILLSCMYIATKNLWMSIAFHLVWNFSLGIVFNSPVSGVQHSSNTLLMIDWDIVNEQYPLMFGGNFGLEGGLLTTIILFISILLVLRLHSPSPYSVANHYRRFFAEQQLIQES